MRNTDFCSDEFSVKCTFFSFIPNYERLIAALQTHPNLQKEPPKLEALRTLKDAVKNKTEIPGERFRKVKMLMLPKF